MTVSKPIREWDRVLVRMPDGMKHELEDRAAENCRPLNGELLFLIKRGMAAETASEPRLQN